MFFELKPEEKIIMTLRRHWLVLTFSLIWFLPVFLIPFVLWLTASYLNIQSVFFAPFFWLFCSLWWLFAWAGLAINWVNIYLDYWIITNQRIISTYQKGLFRREVSELSFSRIQDITVSVKGIIKTFVNYGSLEIRTAGTFDKIREPKEDNVFILEDIPKPYEVQNTLSQIHHDYVNDHSR
ncbi:MAG: hypothetical protein A2Y98_01460 [Candidatus Portnoybacteria bacterium RBG_19FT_COMBO_36_7]|uniref:YdbS-like PH domain-containing protein n=1 Tax=Candidatus Portnoybacteria bacterium RBG_19FT_COMBO_36_7 TaxID=1801992 RepID=A0A1G2F6G8_9BACT|nr:MAG: hypothetical protein A2Y98_01460 [Candidatus Portnoybacteria bacterium RBG_19FT_COMBO_36_7]